MTQTDDIKMVVTHDRQKRQPITAPTRNWRFSASYDSFVVNQTFVLCMNTSLPAGKFVLKIATFAKPETVISNPIAESRI
jgi:hypothetical protein